MAGNIILLHKKIILVDMDGVIANFEQGFLDAYQKKYPELPFIPLEKRVHFKLTDDYPKELHPQVKSIYQADGFYRNLPPINGAVQALLELENHASVFICTSPLTLYDPCVVEKYQWVDAYLGPKWVDRIILTRDKTVVHGNIIIDDKPSIKGEMTPCWEHILYDQPYNRSVADKKKLDWSNWKPVLEPYLFSR